MDLYNKLNITIPKPDWDDIEKTIVRVCQSLKCNYIRLILTFTKGATIDPARISE